MAKRMWVYDIEVAPNFFSAVFIDYTSEEKHVFEISQRRDDRAALAYFIRAFVSNNALIGFNNHEYDDPVLGYVVSTLFDTKHIYSVSCEVINAETWEEIADYRRMFRNLKITSIDLFKHWTKLERRSRKISLKVLAINMRWHLVKELPFDPHQNIPVAKFDEVLFYNTNDVLVTKELAKRRREDFKLRLAIEKDFNFKCLSFDNVKIGTKILSHYYEQATGLTYDDYREKRTHRRSMALSDVILPIYSFNSDDPSFFYDKEGVPVFKSFKPAFDYIYNKKVEDTKSLRISVLYGGVKHDIASGGIHSFHTPGVVVAKPGYKIIDADVASFYPSIGIEWGVYPEHMGPVLATVLQKIKTERIGAKRNGEKNKAESLKLSLNGGYYGNFNNTYSFMYDVKGMLKITINGQLMLCMLSERLTDAGIQVDSLNTDGITCIVPNELEDKYYGICKWWQELTKMELEFEEYTKIVRMNINNYLAVTKQGKVKKKGMFLTDPGLTLSHDKLVIPKAIEAYFVKGIPYEKFIREHTDIFDFCSSPRVDKKYKVMWMNEKQQNLNRFYVSKAGGYLYKQKKGGKLENLLKGHAVMLYNEHVEKPFTEYKVDYNYYINETRKIVSLLLPNQMTTG